MKNVLIRLDSFANLLDKKGLSKYAAELDAITDYVAKGPDSLSIDEKIVEIENGIKDLELSNPLFTDLGALIRHAFSNKNNTLTIKDFVGDVEVPNKVAFVHFLEELKSMIRQEIELSSDDKDLIGSITRIVENG